MTKLWIGLGVLIVIGALFGVLMTLWAKAFSEKEPQPESGEKENGLRAVVHCTGGGAGFSRYRYQGAVDCLAASLLPGGGPLSCEYGCLGMGTCVKVCPEHAIRLQNGAAVVDGERCTACGKCVEACPRHIISLEPFRPRKHVTVPCAAQTLGEETAEFCTDGCIGCSLCVKACPREAVTVEEGLARIDYEKCDNCGLCAQKCPRQLIRVEVVAEPPEPEPPKPPKERKLKVRKPKVEKKPKEKPPKAEKTSGKRSRQDKELHLPKVKLSLKPKKEEKDEEPLKEEPVPELREVPETPEEPAEEKELPGPEPELPAKEEKPAEGARSSAEAFKAFEQAVAAVGEVLGEKKAEPTEEAGPSTDGKTE